MNDDIFQNEPAPAQEPRNDEDRPFTPAERKQVRKLLQADQRRQWVLSTIVTVAKYVSIVGGALIFLQDYIKKILVTGASH